MFISLFFHHCLLLLEHEGWWKNNEIRKMFQVGDPFGKDHRVDEARYSGNSRLSSPELWKNYECLILPIKEPEAKKNANMSGAKGGKEKKKTKPTYQGKDVGKNAGGKKDGASTNGGEGATGKDNPKKKPSSTDAKANTTKKGNLDVHKTCWACITGHACFTRHASHDMHHTTCITRHASRDMHHTTCCTRHASHDMHNTTHHMTYRQGW